MRRIFLTLAAGALWLAASQGALAACGSVVIANMNWASAELMANVDKIVLEKGYGCDASLVPGDTMPTFTSMNEKGAPDVAPELWVNAVRNPLGKAMKEGRLHSLNDGPITGLGEGWWIPPHTAKKHPELKTVLDILKRPDLFPYQEDKSKGAFVGCPAGWGCQLTNANLFRAFEMEKKGWVLVDPGSAAGLDGSLAKAVERGARTGSAITGRRPRWSASSASSRCRSGCLSSAANIGTAASSRRNRTAPTRNPRHGPSPRCIPWSATSS